MLFLTPTNNVKALKASNYQELPYDRQTPVLRPLFQDKAGIGKVKPVWILMKQETTGLQWHQLVHMQVICTSLQTDNHASTSSLKNFTGWMLFLTPNRRRQSTEGFQLSRANLKW